MDYKLRRATKDDTVVLFFSGHGAGDPAFPSELFFVSYDAEQDALGATTVSISSSRFLKKLDARRVLLIADACHSGAASAMGAKAVEQPLETLFRQVEQSKGVVILTSSRSDEQSIEKPGLPNSVFTYYLLKGLQGEADADQDSVVTLREAYDFAYKKTIEETGGIQHPRWGGELEGIFPLALTKLHPAPAHASQAMASQPQIPVPGAGTEKPEERGFSDRCKDYILNSRPLLEAFDENINRRNTKDILRLNQMCHKPEVTECLVPHYRSAAELGDVRAQIFMGYVNHNGLGMTKNANEAFKWYWKAAAGGSTWAQYRLGRFYEDGEHLPKDPQQAAYFYRQAAEQGCTEAQLALGNTLWNKKDYPEAVKWYRELAEKGLVEGFYAFGLAHEFGLGGVRKNREEAIKWFRKAEAKGHEEARKRLQSLGVAVKAPGKPPDRKQSGGKTSTKPAENLSRQR